MADAVYVRNADEKRIVAAAAIASGEIYQLSDGQAAVSTSKNAVSSGERANFTTEGKFTVTKKAGVVVLDGAPLYWDHSANEATPVPPLVTGDKDFFLGTADGDATSAATSCVVNLNVKPRYILDMHVDGGDTAVVLTAGAPYAYNRGGTLEFGFSLTAEAQKLDWMSKRSFPVGSNWIMEGVFEVVTNADADVADFSIGVANGTHASDFEAVTEFAVLRLDMGADLNIDAASDDGTTDVDPADTTIDFAVGTPVHIAIDGRNESNIEMYVNGVLVLDATTFTLAAATGPLKLIAHLEKSSNDSPGVVQIDHLAVRIQETIS